MLAERKLPAPIRPRVRNPLDTSNFDVFEAGDPPPAPVGNEHIEKNPEWDALWEWIEEF